MKAEILIFVLVLIITASCGKKKSDGPSSPPPPPPIEGEDYTGKYHLESVACYSTGIVTELTQYAEVTSPEANIEINGNSFTEKFTSDTGYSEVTRRAVFNEDEQIVTFTQGLVSSSRDASGNVIFGNSQVFNLSALDNDITPNPTILFYIKGRSVTGGEAIYLYDHQYDVLFIETVVWTSASSPSDICFTLFSKTE